MRAAARSPRSTPRRLLAAGLLALALGAAAAAQSEVEETYPDGTVEVRYSVDENGVRHGPYIEYHRNGKLRVKARYRKGLLESLYESYHETGERYVTCAYRRGELHGKYQERWEDGTPYLEGQYRNGKRQGRFEVFEEKKRVAEQEWEAGVLVELDGMVPHPRSREEVLEALERIEGPPADALDPGEIDPAEIDPAELHEEDRQAALKRLQAYRYLCELPYEDMALDPAMNEATEAAARLLEVIGHLDHTPPNPGIPEEEYRLGYRGTSHSNLAITSSMRASVDSYMDDSDPSNIDGLGHRRWCLNPPMKKTGFGLKGRFSAMWSFDSSRARLPTWEAVHYPPRGYVPCDYFGERHAWSVRLNLNRWARLKPDEVEVELWWLDEEYVKVGEALEFDHLRVTADTVAFRPADLQLMEGNRYRVEIRGLNGPQRRDRIDYVVEFLEPRE